MLEKRFLPLYMQDPICLRLHIGETTGKGGNNRARAREARRLPNSLWPSILRTVRGVCWESKTPRKWAIGGSLASKTPPPCLASSGWPWRS